jgi:hypothetical protein
MGAGEVDISPNPGRRITENVDRISYPHQMLAVGPQTLAEWIRLDMLGSVYGVDVDRLMAATDSEQAGEGSGYG